MNRRTILPFLACSASLFACNTGEPQMDEIPAPSSAAVASSAPFDGLVACDELLRPGEKHLVHLWRLSRGVLNAAEGYWSNAGDRIVYQATPDGVACDRIFVTDPRGGRAELISNERGVTTCAYFLPGDDEHPLRVDARVPAGLPAAARSLGGYVWQVHPSTTSTCTTSPAAARRR
jgi:hypothetical protein